MVSSAKFAGQNNSPQKKKNKGKKYAHTKVSVNPIKDKSFLGCSRLGLGKKTPLSKIFHICSTVMKLDDYTLRKEDPKNI